MSDINVADSHVNGSPEEANGVVEPTPAELLAQKHSAQTESHTPAIEEVVDEEDLKHGSAATEEAKAAPVKAAKLDFNSDEAFPSLGPAKAPPKIAVPAWSRNPTTLSAGSFPAPSKALSSVHERTLEFTPQEKAREGEYGEHKSFGSGLKTIEKRNGVRMDVHKVTSTQNTRIILKGKKDSVDRAEHEIRTELLKKIKASVFIPAQVRSFVIGKGGETIRGIERDSGAKITFPKAGEKSNDAPAREANADDGEDEDDEEQVEVKLEGSEYSVQVAKQKIDAIVAARRPPVERTLENVSGHFYPFLAAKVKELRETHGINKLHINVPSYYISESGGPGFSAGKPITIRGDKTVVLQAKQALQDTIAQLEDEITSLQTRIIAPQHRFIVGVDGSKLQSFQEQTGCSVVIPPPNRNVDLIFITGPADKVGAGSSLAKERASSMTLHTRDISKAYPQAPRGAIPHAWDVLRYLQESNELGRLQSQYSVEIETPSVELPTGLPIRIFGPSKDDADKAVSELVALVNAAKPANFRHYPVDPVHQRQFTADHLRKIKSEKNVQVIFTEEDGLALLVADNTTEDIPTALDEAWALLEEVISTFPQVYEKTLDIPAERHSDLIGPRRTTLNALSSGDVHVTVGATVKPLPGREPQAAQPDKLTIRGREAEDVEATVKNILQVYQQLQDGVDINETVRVELEFPPALAGSLIGVKGANINKLKDQYGVDIQMKEGKAQLKGPKHNVEVVRRKINKQVKQLEDTANLALRVPAVHHKTIIGTGGKFVKRLEEKYNVRIRFPKSGDGATGNPDEVTIKGPKKGAAEAKKEIEEVLQYELDNGHTAKVPILARNCKQFIYTYQRELRALREDSGAVINVPNQGENGNDDPEAKLDIKVRGTKKDVERIVKELNKWIKEIESRKTVTLDIEKKFHRSLIGQGGATLRKLVKDAGGPEDKGSHTKFVRIPNAESQDTRVRVEGPADMVDKIVDAINEHVEELRNKVTISVDVPQVSHRKLIGRDGEKRKSIESKFQVSVDVPRQGSSNTAVKITGSEQAVKEAETYILELVKDDEGTDINVPAAFASELLDGGALLRELRNKFSVVLDQKTAAPAGRKQPVRAATESMPLITDAPDAKAQVVTSWTVESGLERADGNEVSWTLRGPLDKRAEAKEFIEKAVEAAKTSSTGYLILSDPSKYRLIVGPGGSTVNGIRKKTGCKITIPRANSDEEAIIITGSEDGCLRARDFIVEIVNGKE
ncbi:hypothetical protein BJ508DRAFT_419956 [Ascobolus immersus RN42]|uniref:K Homology domain-containing protein n=1 Tax=Ascobolus immersus RN42 TaxID=1160509 RepID=A0A3N4H9I6_ASCIM|nr:hypothetical protein BJ508DRAFT_419956 [Ascobolus immersus RN42]